MGQASFEKTLHVLLKGKRKPKCLSRDTVELVKAALAKGTTQRLATDHGWLSESYLRNEKSATGRLWERTKPEELGLTFSKYSLDFLIWITSADLSRKTFWAYPGSESLSLGDNYFLAWAFSTLQGSDTGERWRRRSLFYENGLAVLMHANRFHSPEIEDVDFGPWVTGKGAAILEAMQGRLAKNWVEMEAQKRMVRLPDAMLDYGHAQGTALTRFMDAADAAGRRDLCRFILHVLKKILEKGSELRYWTKSLDTTGLRIADRTEIKEAAAAVLLQANRLLKWHQQSLTCGYLDENYAAMQLWKSDWERLNMQPTIDKAIRIGREVSF